MVTIEESCTVSKSMAAGVCEEAEGPWTVTTEHTEAPPCARETLLHCAVTTQISHSATVSQNCATKCFYRAQPYTLSINWAKSRKPVDCTKAQGREGELPVNFFQGSLKTMHITTCCVSRIKDVREFGLQRAQRMARKKTQACVRQWCTVCGS